MKLNLRIRELREAKGWTLDRLAAQIGVSVPHLSGIERGVKNVNNHLIVNISSALGVAPHELFTRGNDQERALQNLLADLPPEDRERVMDFAKALASSRKD